MRVVIAAPADGAWAPTGNNKIKVQVLRKGQLASEYGAFSLIKVGLHHDDGDEDEVNPELYSMTISNAVKLGSLVIPRIRTVKYENDDTAVEGSNTLNAGNNEVFLYTEIGINRL